MVRNPSASPYRGRPASRHILALLLVSLTLVACGGTPAITPDAIATHVALEQAVAATLTAGAPALVPTDAPDAVATGVAVQQAIAGTLTAEAPTATGTPVALPTACPDLVATGVAVERAVVATRAADATRTAATPEPLEPTLEPSMPPSTSATTAVATALATPDPTATPAPTEPASPPACISWRDAGAYLGTNQCVCGIVTGTYDDPDSSAFFVNFEPDRAGYYAISFEHTFTRLEGRCVKVCGLIEDFRGRPQTVIHTLDQIQEHPTCP